MSFLNIVPGKQSSILRAQEYLQFIQITYIFLVLSMLPDDKNAGMQSCLSDGPILANCTPADKVPKVSRFVTVRT